MTESNQGAVATPVVAPGDVNELLCGLVPWQMRLVDTLLADRQADRTQVRRLQEMIVELVANSHTEDSPADSGGEVAQWAQALKEAERKLVECQQSEAAAREDLAVFVEKLEKADAELAELRGKASELKAAQIAEKTARESYAEIREHNAALIQERDEVKAELEDSRDRESKLLTRLESVHPQGSGQEALPFIERAIVQFEEYPERALKNLLRAETALKGAESDE